MSNTISAKFFVLEADRPSEIMIHCIVQSLEEVNLDFYL